MRRMAPWLAASLAAGIANDGLSAEPAVVASMSAARVIAQADGRETLVAGEEARPGDVIEYRVEYRNSSNHGVSNVVATLPIPANGMEYLPGTETPRGARASTDGENFFAMPLMRAVKLPDGRTVLQPVPVSEYRFLQWSLGNLAADARKSVTARVRLSAGASPAALSPKSAGSH